VKVFLTKKESNRLEKEVEDDLQIAVDRALAAPPPKPETISNYVYSPDIDPTSSIFLRPRRLFLRLPQPMAKKPRPKPWPIVSMPPA